MAKKKAKVVDSFDAVQAGMTKLFGEDAQPLSSADILSRVDFSVSSRSIVVDSILAGGRPFPCSMIPFGRQMEVSGKNGSGKTTMCAQIAAETQAQGGLVCVIDTEDRIDHEYWEKLGVDTSRVINIRAHTIEDVFNKQKKAIDWLNELNSGQPMLMIWDSVGGTTGKDVIEGKSDDFMENAKKMMMREAKLIGTGVKALNPIIAESKVCYLYTNHVYTMPNVTYGDPLTEYGGEKLRFYATVRLRLTKTSELKVEDDFGNKITFGQRVKIKANKNSMAPMKLEKEAIIIGGKGFCNDYTVFDIGKKAKIIVTKGSWSTVTFDDGTEVKFQGWNGFQEKVVGHASYPELLNTIKELL